ncbi:hypothetical protein KUTeg_021483 [Tegillarca granosa]|uniref:YqaJ viral recombinase domain-containing protein n=1 Tax=Tegillarca granosa TaxID=220873 RepID=A0ABQ9E3Q7_TEGGR|nr:hypothetical protein KUTeg_021483 [Tegillarca granosa]
MLLVYPVQRCNFYRLQTADLCINIDITKYNYNKIIWNRLKSDSNFQLFCNFSFTANRIQVKSDIYLFNYLFIFISLHIYLLFIYLFNYLFLIIYLFIFIYFLISYFYLFIYLFCTLTKMWTCRSTPTGTTRMPEKSDAVIVDFHQAHEIEINKIKSVQFGREHEGDAADALMQHVYEEYGDRNIVLYHSGLVINPLMPFLAASPDRILYIEGEGYFVVELKSSLKSENLKQCPTELADASNYYLTVDEEDTVILDREHNYYFQVLGQMAVCNLKKAFFGVWSSYGCHIEQIEFDQVVWDECYEKLQSFYTKHYMKFVNNFILNNERRTMILYFQSFVFAFIFFKMGNQVYIIIK